MSEKKPDLDGGTNRSFWMGGFALWKKRNVDAFLVYKKMMDPLPPPPPQDNY